jgi:hypothetical protein
MGEFTTMIMNPNGFHHSCSIESDPARDWHFGRFGAGPAHRDHASGAMLSYAPIRFGSIRVDSGRFGSASQLTRVS